jgi:flagellar basal body rod protein FlgB
MPCSTRSEEGYKTVTPTLPRCIGQYPNSFGRDAYSTTASEPMPHDPNCRDIDRYTSESVDVTLTYQVVIAVIVLVLIYANISYSML